MALAAFALLAAAFAAQITLVMVGFGVLASVTGTSALAIGFGETAALYLALNLVAGVVRGDLTRAMSQAWK